MCFARVGHAQVSDPIIIQQVDFEGSIISDCFRLIRDGQSSVAELMQIGKEILGFRHVQPAVPGLMHDVQVEGTL